MLLNYTTFNTFHWPIVIYNWKKNKANDHRFWVRSFSWFRTAAIFFQFSTGGITKFFCHEIHKSLHIVSQKSFSPCKYFRTQLILGGCKIQLTFLCRRGNKAKGNEELSTKASCLDNILENKERPSVPSQPRCHPRRSSSKLGSQSQRSADAYRALTWPRRVTDHPAHACSDRALRTLTLEADAILSSVEIWLKTDKLLKKKTWLLIMILFIWP